MNDKDWYDYYLIDMTLNKPIFNERYRICYKTHIQILDDTIQNQHENLVV